MCLQWHWFFIVIAVSPVDTNKTKAPIPEPIIKQIEIEEKDDDVLTIYPYDRLTTMSTNPVTDIDVTKREVKLNI